MGTDSRPEVTVVIPTKDRWELLHRAALRAALLQEDVALEVIVVDDGSSDAMPRELLQEGETRVRVVRHDAPRGVATARNTGIGEARGAGVAFLDDDDRWSPRKLREQLDAASAEDADFAYSAATWVDGGGRVIRAHAPVPPETLAVELLRWNVLWGGASNVLARTALLRSLGGFDERLFQLADWDLWIRLALAAHGATCGALHVALLVHEESMLVVDRRDVFTEFELLAEKHRAANHAAGVELDRAGFARWVAGGHLRAGRRRAAARTYLRGTYAPGNAARAATVLVAPSGLSAARRLRRLATGEASAHRPERPGWLEFYR